MMSHCTQRFCHGRLPPASGAGGNICCSVVVKFMATPLKFSGRGRAGVGEVPGALAASHGRTRERRMEHANIIPRGGQAKRAVTNGPFGVTKRERRRTAPVAPPARPG